MQTHRRSKRCAGSCVGEMLAWKLGITTSNRGGFSKGSLPTLFGADEGFAKAVSSLVSSMAKRAKGSLPGSWEFLAKTSNVEVVELLRGTPQPTMLLPTS